ncbi:unnamed protein product, partial [Symbiodinium microadriaticum]
VTIPSGGFFAQRLAAQVTNQFDQRPNYVLSSGSYIYKEPNTGITIAKVVSQLGGGNAMPFRGDQMNVLYARLHAEQLQQHVGGSGFLGFTVYRV